MSLYQECLNFMNKESSNDAEKISGYYSLGTLKTNGWKAVISVNVLEEEYDGEGRDIIVTPMLLVPRYINGRKTNSIKEKLELNSNAEYIFWQAKERNKAMFDKIKCKLTDEKELNDAPLVEKQGASNQFCDSVFHYLKEYSDCLGYSFQSILDELKNDFEIETDF